jgi:RNA polymerase sigma-70 factor (ECF subfamily)
MRAEAEPSDGDLMQLAARGERDAFATLYRRHRDSVYRFARLMTGSPALAEDVVQEVFLAVMRAGSTWNPARSSFSTYVYGVARHITRRRMTRERRFVTLDDPATPPCEPVTEDDVSSDLVRRAEVTQLRRAIVKLPSRYREAVVLCDLQGLSYAEAACALECAVGTVRSRLHRARKLLSERIHRSESGREAALAPVVRCEA